MLWNLELDKKIKLHTHNSLIGSFLFCGKFHKYIISLDISTKPTIIFSDWTNFTKICQKKLIKKSKETLNCKAVYIERKKMILFIENFSEKSYSRLIVGEIKNDNFICIFIESMQNIHDCLAIHYFDYNYTISLVTVEKFNIKIWKLMSDKIILENRVHSKDEISESFLNVERNLMYFVTSRNVLNVINQEVNKEIKKYLIDLILGRVNE